MAHDLYQRSVTSKREKENEGRRMKEGVREKYRRKTEREDTATQFK